MSIEVDYDYFSLNLLLWVITWLMLTRLNSLLNLLSFCNHFLHSVGFLSEFILCRLLFLWIWKYIVLPPVFQLHFFLLGRLCPHSVINRYTFLPSGSACRCFCLAVCHPSLLVPFLRILLKPFSPVFDIIWVALHGASCVSEIYGESKFYGFLMSLIPPTSQA